MKLNQLHMPPNQSFITGLYNGYSSKSGLAVALCNFDLSQFSLAVNQNFDIVIPDSIMSSVVKRKSEYLAGRIASKYALEQFHQSDCEIKIGEHRSPIWPEGVAGSITHNATTAIAVASPSVHQSYLGIDLENCLTEQTAEEIKKQIISAEEEDLIKTCLPTFEQALTLFFSAKESLFKALYTQVGYYFDFSAARVTRFDVHTQKLTLCITQQLSDEIQPGNCYEAGFSLQQNKVLTLVSEHLPSSETLNRVARLA